MSTRTASEQHQNSIRTASKYDAVFTHTVYKHTLTINTVFKENEH